MNSKEILIVDDVSQNVQVLGSLLKKEGFNICFATNGPQALQAVAKQHPSLILLDINMPGMDGFEVCRRLKADDSTCDIPIIFLTANTNDDTIAKGFEVGAVDYVTKPFRPKELISRVNTHIRLQQALQDADAASQAKSAFLANMSHEIRTPMNAILGFCEILQSKLTDPKLIHHADTIYSSGSALLRLINDILDFSKIESGKFELQYSPVNIRPLFKDLIAIFIPEIQKKDLRFIVEISDQLPHQLLLDDTRIRQVLINFLGNAIKFTHTGFIRLAANFSTQGDNQHFGKLEIVVEDSGIGIPEGQQSQVFEAFEQVTGQNVIEYGGTGLGLPISLQLIQLMQGDIHLTSTVDQGSTFKIELPEIEVAGIVDNSPKDPQTKFTVTSAKILIVDDIDYNRELLVLYLEEFNFDIRQACNGEEALERAREFNPDLILLDMKMPVMDGYEASRHLRKDPDLKDIPIVAVTASAYQKDFDIINELCDGCLAKPVKKRDLLYEINQKIG